MSASRNGIRYTTPREWTRRQGRPKTRWRDTRVAKNSQRPASVETVQGGVPPYGVKETLVVNGGTKETTSHQQEEKYGQCTGK